MSTQTINKTKCRQLFHTVIQDPKHDKLFCSKCNSHVVCDLESRFCPCCNSPIKKQKKYGLLKIMLNNSIDDYEHLVIAWLKKPVPNVIILEQKWKYVTYRLPICVIALYYEMYEPIPVKDRKGDFPIWINQVWNKNEIKELQKKGLLPFLNKQVKQVGIF